MRRIIAFLLLTATVLLQLSACAVDTNIGEPYVRFTDDVGNDVALKCMPARVAVLFSSFADIWTIAGGEIAITVGETVERGFADADTLLVDSGAGKTINTELLISYAPDLVICSADVKAQTDAAELLRSVGIPAACFRVEAFNDYLRVLSVFTDITQNKAAYEKYGAETEKEINTLLANLPKDITTPNILFIRAGSSARSTKAKNASQHFACAMLSELGAYNIADSAPILLDGLSIEEILRQNPEIIFITSMGDEEASRAYVTSLFTDSVWSTLGAVKNGRYYFLEKDLFQYKPNAKWLEAYKTLAEILYEEKE